MFGQKKYLCTVQRQQHPYYMKQTIAIILILAAAIAPAQDFKTLYTEGIAHIKEKNYAKAAESFEQALKFATGEEEQFGMYLNLAYSSMMAGYTDKALENYNRAIGLRGYDRALYFQRAATYMQAGHYDEAIEDCNTILHNTPDDTDAQLMRAQAYMTKGDNRKAREEFIAITERTPGNLNARLGLAMTYKNEKLYEKAMLLIGLLIEESPANAALYIARSDIERELEQYELALMDVEQAIALETDNAEYYTLQAILLEKCGKRSAATNSRKRAEKLKNDAQNR